MEKYNLRLIPARQARLAEEKMALQSSVKVKRANHRLKIKKRKNGLLMNILISPSP